MKKPLALSLTLVMLLSLCVPAFAEEQPLGRVNDRIPTVLITGDGEPIVIPDETAENGERVVFITRQFLSMDMDSSGDGIQQSIINVLKPFFAEGVLRGNWEPYYENLEKEISDLFAEVRLDENGNAVGGTNVGGWNRWVNWYNANNDNKGDKGYYAYDDYHFWYDWRLDPMEIAVQLHDYIQGVKAVTHSDQVSLFASCLGSNVALAYLKLYGPDDFYGLGIDATVSVGSEFMSEALAGDVKLDGNAINRFLADGMYFDWFNPSDFITDTIDLAEKSGLLDGVSKAIRATLFDKVSAGMISAIALGSFFTMPCYWACIDDEHFDKALYNVFGPEGSEKRQTYAGLIQKITKYHEEVMKNIPTLLTRAKESGTRICVLAKYGLQQLPILKSNDLISDQFASLHKATFGATTATIYDTLSDAYIDARIAEGKGKYISADKQVDTSTCLFPDYTWVIKGADHTVRSNWENERIYTVITADRQCTIDDFEGSAFFVYDRKTDITAPMTPENCHTEHWTADKDEDDPQGIFAKLRVAIASFLRWCKSLYAVIQAKLAEQQAEPAAA